MSESMLANFFAINVKPEMREAFVGASIFEAQSVVSEEEDVFQFHLMEDEADPNRFYFFEVYRDKSALRTHRETEVYKNWRRTIDPMLEGEVETLARMRSIFPSAKGLEAQKPGLLLW